MYKQISACYTMAYMNSFCLNSNYNNGPFINMILPIVTLALPVRDSEPLPMRNEDVELTVAVQL